MAAVAVTAMAYERRRAAIETYFDRTAAEAWSRLTSDAPLGRVRSAVRAGRDAMRRTLLAMLPHNLAGARVLDAGCGTGTLATALAARGAEVVAVDLSPTLIDLARRRTEETVAGNGRIDWRIGDMTDPALGAFDHMVAMDSLIHYEPADAVAVLARVAPRIGVLMAITFAPRTPLLAVMHAAGKIFPRGDRSPAIVPVSPGGLRGRIAAAPALAPWTVGRTERVARPFYVSEALVLARRT